MATVYLLSQNADSNTRSAKENACVPKMFDAVEQYLSNTSISVHRAHAFPTEVFTLTPEEKRTTIAIYGTTTVLHSHPSCEVNYDAYSFRSFTLASFMQQNLAQTADTTMKPYTAADLIGSFLRTLPSCALTFDGTENSSKTSFLCSEIETCAWQVALAIASYFNITLIEATPPQPAIADLNYGNLNIRQYPSVNAPIIDKVTNGTQLEVNSRIGEWYMVRYNGKDGYVNGQYIVLQY